MTYLPAAHHHQAPGALSVFWMCVLNRLTHKVLPSGMKGRFLISLPESHNCGVTLLHWTFHQAKMENFAPVSKLWMGILHKWLITPPQFNLKGSRNETLLCCVSSLWALTCQQCAVVSEAVNGLLWTSATVQKQETQNIHSLWIINWFIQANCGSSLRMRQAPLWLEDCGLTSGRCREMLG